MTSTSALKACILPHPIRYLLLFLFINTAQAQTPSIDIVALRDAASRFQKARPREKVYLHTDKDVYFAGDTLWFKAYVLDATLLSASESSKLLFIEIHNDSLDVIRRVSVILKNGIGNAQIPLTKNAFNDGRYTIKAYTNWMQNFESSTAFSKKIYIAKIFNDSWVASLTINTKTNDGKENLLGEVQLQDLSNMPVGLRDLNVRLIDSNRILLNKNLQTSLDGRFPLQIPLPASRRVNNLKIEILDLRKDGTKQRIQIPVIIDRPKKIDLQFLPEGGNLVAGVTNTIGFKAISENGKGININGLIFDSKGNEVTIFKSLHKGIGSFTFKPIYGEKYYAKIDVPIGAEMSYNLPSAKLSGANIILENDEQHDSLKVIINGSADLLKKQQLFYLIGVSRGLVCYGIPIILNESKSIMIAKRLFPEGITRFLLLKDKMAINERSVFIYHYDNLNIKLSNLQPTYKTRDKVSLEVEVKDKFGKPVMGSFSLSVTDDGQVSGDKEGNHSIDVNLLLNSDLKGLIEEPGFYFNKSVGFAWKALDNLLLTQGWVGYDWNDILQPTEPPRYDRITFSKTRWNSVKHMEFPAVSDYQIKPWFVIDTTRKNLYPKEAILSKISIANSNLLNEVTIKGKRQWRGSRFADIALDSNDIKVTGALNVLELLKKILPGISIEPVFSEGSGKRYTLKWQGRQIWFTTEIGGSADNIGSFEEESKFNLKEFWMEQTVQGLELIEIMFSDQYTNKYLSNRILPDIKQRKPLIIRQTYIKSSPSDFTNPLSILLAKRYYQPKYLTQSLDVKIQRATVHWEPNIITNKDGKAFISFFATDEVGSYSLNVQGSDLKGRLGSYYNSIKIN